MNKILNQAERVRRNLLTLGVMLWDFQKMQSDVYEIAAQWKEFEGVIRNEIEKENSRDIESVEYLR